MVSSEMRQSRMGGTVLTSQRRSTLPELYLSVSTRTLRVWGAFLGTKDERGFPLRTQSIRWLCAATAAITCRLCVGTLGEGGSFWGGAITSDPLSVGAKTLLTGATARCLVGRRPTVKEERRDSFEYPILRLFALLGRRLLVSASNLIRFYLALELQSLCLYVLAAYQRGSAYSTEAGLKYFVRGAFASGLFLYGCSLVYGTRGTVNYSERGRLLLRPDWDASSVTRGFALRRAAIFFKMGAAPFHRWAPDVMEGAPTPSSRFFGAVTKVAVIAGLVRWFYGPFNSLRENLRPRVGVVAGLSRLVGAFGALRQRRWKRFLAYSTIGHRGYLLMGLTAGTVEGLQGRRLYRTVYVVRSVNVWTSRRALRRESGDPVVFWSDITGLGRDNSPIARGLAVALLSRAGVPPRGGFRAKARAFLPARNVGRLGLCFVAVATAVVGAFYYLRVLKVRYFDTSEETSPWQEVPAASAVVRGVTLGPTVLLRLYPEPLLVRTHHIAVWVGSGYRG